MPLLDTQYADEASERFKAAKVLAGHVKSTADLLRMPLVKGRDSLWLVAQEITRFGKLSWVEQYLTPEVLWANATSSGGRCSMPVFKLALYRPWNFKVIAPMLTLEMLLSPTHGSPFIELIEDEGLLDRLDPKLVRQAMKLISGEKLKEHTMKTRAATILEADAPINPEVGKTSEHAYNVYNEIKPSKLSKYGDFAADYDEPCTLLAFDLTGSLTGQLGYSVKANTAVEAIAALRARCLSRLSELGQVPPPATGANADGIWFSTQTSRGMLVFIGRRGKPVEAVISRFPDSDLKPAQISSLFTVFYLSKAQDDIIRYPGADVPPAERLTLEKFLRLKRRSVRNFAPA